MEAVLCCLGDNQRDLNYYEECAECATNYNRIANMCAELGQIYKAEGYLPTKEENFWEKGPVCSMRKIFLPPKSIKKCENSSHNFKQCQNSEKMKMDLDIKNKEAEQLSERTRRSGDLENVNLRASFLKDFVGTELKETIGELNNGKGQEDSSDEDIPLINEKNLSESSNESDKENSPLDISIEEDGHRIPATPNEGHMNLVPASDGLLFLNSVAAMLTLRNEETKATQEKEKAGAERMYISVLLEKVKRKVTPPPASSEVIPNKNEIPTGTTKQLPEIKSKGSKKTLEIELMEPQPVLTTETITPPRPLLQNKLSVKKLSTAPEPNPLNVNTSNIDNNPGEAAKSQAQRASTEVKGILRSSLKINTSSHIKEGELTDSRRKKKKRIAPPKSVWDQVREWFENIWTKISQKRIDPNKLLTPYQRIATDLIMLENEDAEPEYLLWKRVLQRVVNRCKGEAGNVKAPKSKENYHRSNSALEEAELKYLKSFLVRRSVKRQRNIFASQSVRMFYNVIASKGRINDKEYKVKDSLRSALVKAQMDKAELAAMSKYSLYPNSSFRRFWDIIVILLVMYNIFLIPLDVGLGTEAEEIRSTFESLIDIIFGLDILLNFFTGYVDNMNHLIMNPKSIATRYLQSWFFIDVISTLPFDKIADIFSIGLNIPMKIFAILKIPRLLRLGKILKFLDNIKGAFIWRMAKLFIVFFLMTHWIGCFWYWSAGPSDFDNNVETFLDRYIFALYYGVQLLVGQDPSPSRNLEVLFCIGASMMGQAVTSTVWGSMADLIKTMDKGEDIFSNKMDFINEHMRYYQIPNEIQDDVRQYYDYIWLRHRELIYGKEHFEQLAKNLEEGMQQHRYRVLMKEIDFFKDCRQGFVYSILISIKPVILSPGEIIYHEGEMSKGLYFNERGTVELFSDKTKKLYEKVKAVNYFGLEVLMLKTARHWCTALTRDYADLHLLPLESFDRIIADYPKESDKLRRIAIKKLEKLKVLADMRIFQMVALHSSRCIGKNYETVYTPKNIWMKPMWTPNYQKLSKILMFVKRFKSLLKPKEDTTKRRNSTKENLDSPEDKGNKDGDIFAGLSPPPRKPIISLSHNFIEVEDQQHSETESQLKPSRIPSKLESLGETETKILDLFRTAIGKIVSKKVNTQTEFLEGQIDEIYHLFELRVEKLEALEEKLRNLGL